ncbi:hypothetical protein DSM25558_4093 [Agrobacterium sp. DSM 25558]|nr:hypothetical protein DSM25558_4093 [Agrobacterium sp. DSM 25558]
MRTAAFSVLPRLFARAWILDWFSEKSIGMSPSQEDEMQDHIKRDLGLLDGRDRIGPGRARQSDELREAIRLLPRSL